MLENQFNSFPILAGSYQFRYPKLGRLKNDTVTSSRQLLSYWSSVQQLMPIYKRDWTAGLDAGAVHVNQVPLYNFEPKKKVVNLFILLVDYYYYAFLFIAHKGYIPLESKPFSVLLSYEGRTHFVLLHTVFLYE